MAADPSLSKKIPKISSFTIDNLLRQKPKDDDDDDPGIAEGLTRLPSEPQVLRPVAVAPALRRTHALDSVPAGLVSNSMVALAQNSSCMSTRFLGSSSMPVIGHDVLLVHPRLEPLTTSGFLDEMANSHHHNPSNLFSYDDFRLSSVLPSGLQPPEVAPLNPPHPGQTYSQWICGAPRYGTISELSLGLHGEPVNKYG